MDLLTFPSLGSKYPVSHPLTPLNYLSKVKEAEAKREEESIYDHTRVASMTKKQLIKEGWAIVNKTVIEYDDTRGRPKLDTASSEMQISPLPFHPDSPHLKRKVITSRPSYTDLYDIDYENDNTGAIVPVYDGYREGDDGENSV